MDLIKRLNPKGDFANEVALNALEQENGFLKKVIQEKDYFIQKYENQIKDLEAKVLELESLKHDIPNNVIIDDRGKEIDKTVALGQAVSTQELNSEESSSTINHIYEIEEAFQTLLQKYDKAKTVIFGLEQNQTALQNQMEIYKKILSQMEEKYNEFKTYALEKLKKANKHLEVTNKYYANETQRLKTKILQCQHKIKELELEKTSSCSQLRSCVLKHGCSNGSIFEPLVTNFN